MLTQEELHHEVSAASLAALDVPAITHNQAISAAFGVVGAVLLAHQAACRGCDVYPGVCCEAKQVDVNA
jgi:hypothetical protein